MKGFDKLSPNGGGAPLPVLRAFAGNENSLRQAKTQSDEG
jgi:hypothetical protein